LLKKSRVEPMVRLAPGLPFFYGFILHLAELGPRSRLL
jgi:hypothetical protein